MTGSIVDGKLLGFVQTAGKNDRIDSRGYVALLWF